jgi:hypothetical protein
MSLTASVSPLIALGGACRRRHCHHNAPPGGEPQEPVPLAQPTDDRKAVSGAAARASRCMEGVAGRCGLGRFGRHGAGSVAGSVRVGLVGSQLPGPTQSDSLLDRAVAWL